MHQVAIDAERADFDRGVVEFDRGLVGDADGVDIALPVVDDVDWRRGLRRGQRGCFVTDAGNALPTLLPLK